MRRGGWPLARLEEELRQVQVRADAADKRFDEGQAKPEAQQAQKSTM